VPALALLPVALLAAVVLAVATPDAARMAAPETPARKTSGKSFMATPDEL
jgi:hypothetical protein